MLSLSPRILEIPGHKREELCTVLSLTMIPPRIPFSTIMLLIYVITSVRLHAYMWKA